MCWGFPISGSAALPGSTPSLWLCEALEEQGPFRNIPESSTGQAGWACTHLSPAPHHPVAESVTHPICSFFILIQSLLLNCEATMSTRFLNMETVNKARKYMFQVSNSLCPRNNYSILLSIDPSGNFNASINLHIFKNMHSHKWDHNMHSIYNLLSLNNIFGKSLLFHCILYCNLTCTLSTDT